MEYCWISMVRFPPPPFYPPIFLKVLLHHTVGASANLNTVVFKSGIWSRTCDRWERGLSAMPYRAFFCHTLYKVECQCANKQLHLWTSQCLIVVFKNWRAFRLKFLATSANVLCRSNVQMCWRIGVPEDLSDNSQLTCILRCWFHQIVCGGLATRTTQRSVLFILSLPLFTHTHTHTRARTHRWQTHFFLQVWPLSWSASRCQFRNGQSDLHKVCCTVHGKQSSRFSGRCFDQCHPAKCLDITKDTTETDFSRWSTFPLGIVSSYGSFC